MLKILFILFISIFMLGCQSNNTFFEDTNITRDASGSVEENVNISSDGNDTHNIYENYSANDADTPPPVPKFEN